MLDWFHLAMRIQHVARAVKGWPGNRNDDRQEGARFADAVEHVRWRLWHGQVQRALDLIGDTAEVLGDAVASPARATTRARWLQPLRGLEMYVAGQAELIIDYAAARRRRGANIDGADRKHRAMAASSPDSRKPVDALVAAGSAYDAGRPRTAVANGTL